MSKLLVALVLVLVCGAVPAIAQNKVKCGDGCNQIDLSKATGMMVADNERVDELKKSINLLFQAQVSLEGGQVNLLQRIAVIAKLQQELPKNIFKEVQDRLEKALKSSSKEFTGQLGQVRKELVDYVAALERRLEAVEKATNILGERADAAEKNFMEVEGRVTVVEEKIGINLIPQASVIGTNDGLAVVGGVELLLPTKTSWLVSLQGNVGGIVTGKAKPLYISAGLGLLKKQKAWLLWGPTIDASFTDTSHPGVCSITPTAGMALVFKVHKHFEFMVTAGAGPRFEHHKISFGWNAGAGVGIPIF